MERSGATPAAGGPGRSRPEVADLAEAAAELVGAVTDVVAGVHRAVADRSFGGTGSAALPVRAVHDRISSGVYGAVRVGARVGLGLGAAAAATHPGVRSWAPLRDGAGGRKVAAAVCGIVGDQLEADGNGLAVPMAVRHDGHDVALTAEGLATAFPDARGRLAVFVHGLCEDEQCWDGEEVPGGYPAALAADPGLTPVLLRYNTGLALAGNGDALSACLDELVAHWPTPVVDLTLIGHSMGGLVSRHALAEAHDTGRRWAERCQVVVCLGSPHHGAPLERWVHAGGEVLGVLPEVRPFVDLLARRSTGIRDLRHGVALAAPAGVRHHLVAGVLTGDVDHPVARILGDGLVDPASALADDGGERTLLLDDDSTRHLVPGRGHLRLLDDPDVADRLRHWLAEPLPAVPPQGNMAPWQPGRSTSRSPRS